MAVQDAPTRVGRHSGRMRRLALVGGLAVASSALVALTGSTVVLDGSPALELVDDQGAALLPQDPECAQRRRDSDQGRLWNRDWQLSGHMAGMTGRWRGLDIGFGRSVVVWKEQRWHEADLSEAMRGAWDASGGTFRLLATDGSGHFGVGFEPLGAAAERICGLQVTAPLGGGANVTWGVNLAQALRWTELGVGTSEGTTTVGGAEFSVQRTTATQWVFELGALPRGPDFFDHGRLTLTTDSSKPPWDHIEIDVEMVGLTSGARGHLELQR